MGVYSGDEQLAYTYAGHDGTVDVFHDTRPRLTLDRRPVRQHRRQVAGLHFRQNSSTADRLQVVGHVVDHFASSLPELRRIHYSTSTADTADADDDVVSDRSISTVCL